MLISATEKTLIEVRDAIIDLSKSINGAFNQLDNGKVEKDQGSTVPFSIGVDDGGLFCITNQEVS